MRAGTAAVVAFAILELIALARYTGSIAWGKPSSWLYVAFLFAVAFAVEGRADVPSSGETARGRIETGLLGAALLPCFHVWWVELCGVGFVGAIRGASTGIAEPRLDSHVFGAAGGRAGIAIPLWRALALHVRADVLAPLTRITFTVNDLPDWTTPPVQGSVGVGALGQF